MEGLTVLRREDFERTGNWLPARRSSGYEPLDWA
jgi:hypothetical protein